jgi:hypothetical protein
MKKLFTLIVFFCLLAGKTSAQQVIDDVQPHDPSFVLHGTAWNHRFLTYKFVNYTGDITSSAARTAVQNAMAEWSRVGRIYFIEACPTQTEDISISWNVGNHGDGNNFDGPYGLLAHAFYPTNSGSIQGDVHFDDDETWTDAPVTSTLQPMDLQSVALHELGHSLGLEHTDPVAFPGAVMVNIYQGTNRTLSSDDANGIIALYTGAIQFITGPDNFTGSAAFGIGETLPSGYSVSWGISPASCVSISPSGNTATVSSIYYTGPVTITCTLSNGCNTLTFTRVVNVIAASLPVINGDPIICIGGASNLYSLSNLPAGSTAVWSVSPVGAATIATPTATSTTITPAADGDITLIADVYGDCGSHVAIPKAIHVGPPTPIEGVTTRYSQIHCVVNGYISTIGGADHATHFDWSYENVTQSLPYTPLLSHTGTQRHPSDGSCDQINMKVEVANVCNLSTPEIYIFPSDMCPPFTAGDCSYGRTITVTPNPVSNNVLITLHNDKKVIPAYKQPNQIVSVKVMDKAGKVRKVIMGNRLDHMLINLSDLPTDTYILLASDGNIWMSSTIVKIR